MQHTLRLATMPGIVPWTLGPRTFAWGTRTFVMGILNVTPDSFSDGGTHEGLAAAIAHAERLLAEGADLIDIGGESTRPGSDSVPLEVELQRVIPIVKHLAAHTEAVLSIDTSKPEVAEAALDAGAHLINDVTGLRSPEMIQVLARTGAPAVAMHMQGTPRTMQVAPQYADVVREVRDELAETLARAREAGVTRVMVDPGIGFGKTFEHNLELMRHLSEFKTLDAPMLVGTSRKGFIGTLLDLPVTERVEGTMATVSLAIAQGADVVRVHDVKEAVRTVRVADAIVRGGRHG